MTLQEIVIAAVALAAIVITVIYSLKKKSQPTEGQPKASDYIPVVDKITTSVSAFSNAVESVSQKASSIAEVITSSSPTQVTTSKSKTKKEPAKKGRKKTKKD